MKGYNKWSYAPYKPLINDGAKIYISRVAPNENSVHFEWISNDTSFNVFYKKRDAADFILYKTTSAHECDIPDLEPETDYEFKVLSDKNFSPVRLFRTGKVVGTATPYLLAKIKDITGGDSLASNIRLVYNNAALAAQIAASL